MATVDSVSFSCYGWWIVGRLIWRHRAPFSPSNNSRGDCFSMFPMLSILTTNILQSNISKCFLPFLCMFFADNYFCKWFLDTIALVLQNHASVLCSSHNTSLKIFLPQSVTLLHWKLHIWKHILLILDKFISPLNSIHAHTYTHLEKLKTGNVLLYCRLFWKLFK